MNLDKLFQAQKELREHINYNGEDRFEKLVLALLVEIGECANEWRGFKFWSKDQEPRTKVPVTEWGVAPYKNPLLEEYVDGLHFVLELGIEHGVDELINVLAIDIINYSDITTQFRMLFLIDWEIYKEGEGGYYHEGLELYLGLGKMLGFTWDEIEVAYFAKNQINHSRQENGY